MLGRSHPPARKNGAVQDQGSQGSLWTLPRQRSGRALEKPWPQPRSGLGQGCGGAGVAQGALSPPAWQGDTKAPPGREVTATGPGGGTVVPGAAASSRGGSGNFQETLLGQEAAGRTGRRQEDVLG